MTSISQRPVVSSLTWLRCASPSLCLRTSASLHTTAPQRALLQGVGCSASDAQGPVQNRLRVPQPRLFQLQRPPAVQSSPSWPLGRRFASTTKSAHAPEVAPREAYDLLIPDLFRKAARRHALLPALDGPSLSMNYKELDEATDALAAFLRIQYRVAPETVVGVYMDRCEEYVIAVLAILKAGAAYCPIEVAYPPPLLRYAFEEVEPRVVLTKESLAGNVPLSIGKFSLEGDWRGVVDQTSPDLKVLEEDRGTPDSLGYVIMSGGSTGKPKGIEAPHKSMVASYLWRYSISGYGPGSRVGCNVFFVWEIFRPLFRGGTTVVIPDDIIFDAHRLAPYLQSKAVTEVLFTPSLFETLLNTCDTSFLQSLPLQVVWLNGEVVTTKLAQQARQHLPHVTFCNTYSISECGEVCSGLLQADRDDCPKFCPVGKIASFAEHRIMSTDATEPEEVLKGEAGELWIAGRGTGRGYTKSHTAKMREVFIEHEGKYFYRTGDLVRELHDGVMEVLGRCDFMVKVRGYSVVLGAVEAAIFKQLGAGQAVVVAKGDEGTDKRLVAYLTPCSPGELRGRVPVDLSAIDEYGRSPPLFQELIKELPHYAVPSVYVVLDSLPINPVSLKANRQALPPPPTPPPPAVVPPGFRFDGTKESCQLVFEEVLGLPAGTLQAQSNFFELGGHSLLITQLLARITELGGPQISVADFILAPTVDGVASLATGKEVTQSPSKFLPHEVEKYTAAMSDISMGVQAYWRYTVFTNNSQRVMLTGATGYVGVFLLARLLKHTSCQVFCIVRPPAGVEDRYKAATDRLTEHLQTHGFGDVDLDRLQVIPGDVSLPNMGMDAGEHLFLQQLVDVVIHAAANVNLAYTYDLLESTNVQGTVHALEFARGGKVKALHYISTNGIFPEVGEPGSFSEADTPPHHLLQTGYAQTKWVSEQLVLKARDLGLPCVVYRLGNVAGPMHGSGWNESDSNLLFLRACLERGAVPDADWSLEFTPVDFVAEFVHNCMMDLKFANTKTFHLINEKKLSLQLFAQLAARVGFTVGRKDTQAWCETTGKKQAGLLSIVLGQEALASLLGRHHSCSQSNTFAGCEHFGMNYPVPSDTLLSTYLRRLVSERLLPSPMSLPGRLSGKVAVVTGASSGIGRAIARTLAGEGATVVIMARRAKELQEVASQLPGDPVVKVCDVTSRKDVHAAIADVEDRLGRIDIVANVAGVMYFTMMKNLHYDEWERTIEVNCKGIVNVTGATLPIMQKAGTGHYVNISSDAARTLFPALTVYNASKAFVNTFSRGLRAELVGSGIRVTDIQPGDTATNLIMENTDQEAANKVGVKIGEVCAAGSPREYYLDPEDVAESVLNVVCLPAHVGVHEIVIEPRDQMYGDPTALGD